MTIEIIRHPSGWRVELDRAEVSMDDPGQGTPAMVYSPSGASATYQCALVAGEVLDTRCNPMRIPNSVYAWLESLDDEVEAFLYSQ